MSVYNTLRHVDYGCHVTAGPGAGLSPLSREHSCVMDSGRKQDCMFAKTLNRKEDCWWWREMSTQAVHQAA